MSATITPRQQVIIDLLAAGPRTLAELVDACGYEDGSRSGRSHVRMMITRLSRRGYEFVNVRPAGSHRGACYLMLSRPAADVRPDEKRCLRCGHRLASDHRQDDYCSPCQRRLVAMELDWQAPATLFEAVSA